MKILLIQKGTLTVTTLNAVSNIAAVLGDTDYYAITNNGTTTNYRMDQYKIQILW